MLAGHRIVVLVLLAAWLAAGSPTLRQTAGRLLACGVSLQAGEPTGGVGASAVSAISGTRVRRTSRDQCLREAIGSTMVAKRWILQQRGGE